MSIRIVRLGSPRGKGEGTRIGTVRRPPRGVPKAEFASQDWYDVWFPTLAPSLETMKLGLAADTPAHVEGLAVPRRDAAPSASSLWQRLSRQTSSAATRRDALRAALLPGGASRTTDFRRLATARTRLAPLPSIARLRPSPSSSTGATAADTGA